VPCGKEEVERGTNRLQRYPIVQEKSIAQVWRRNGHGKSSWVKDRSPNIGHQGCAHDELDFLNISDRG